MSRRWAAFPPPYRTATATITRAKQAWGSWGLSPLPPAACAAPRIPAPSRGDTSPVSLVGRRCAAAARTHTRPPRTIAWGWRCWREASRVRRGRDGRCAQRAPGRHPRGSSVCRKALSRRSAAGRRGRRATPGAPQLGWCEAFPPVAFGPLDERLRSAVCPGPSDCRRRRATGGCLQNWVVQRWGWECMSASKGAGDARSPAAPPTRTQHGPHDAPGRLPFDGQRTRSRQRRPTSTLSACLSAHCLPTRPSPPSRMGSTRCKQAPRSLGSATRSTAVWVRSVLMRPCWATTPSASMSMRTALRTPGVCQSTRCRPSRNLTACWSARTASGLSSPWKTATGSWWPGFPRSVTVAARRAQPGSGKATGCIPGCPPSTGCGWCAHGSRCLTPQIVCHAPSRRSVQPRLPSAAVQAADGRRGCWDAPRTAARGRPADRAGPARSGQCGRCSSGGLVA